VQHKINIVVRKQFNQFGCHYHGRKLVEARGVTGMIIFSQLFTKARSFRTYWFQRWTPCATRTWWTCSFSTNGLLLNLL